MAEYSSSAEGRVAHVRHLAHQNMVVLHHHMAKVVVHVDLWMVNLPDHHPIHFQAELEVVLPSTIPA